MGKAQDCSNPDGNKGDIIYNQSYGAFQGCTQTGWHVFNPPACPDGDGCVSGPTNCDNIGDQCDDGSFYIGDSPEDGAKVYMTSAAHEVSLRWDSGPCLRCGDGSIATGATDGRANTSALLAFNAAGFDAAAYCDGLDAHEQDDWYLPAGGSGTGTEQNLFWAMIQAEGIVDGIGSNSGNYWSSSEESSNSAKIHRFSDGTQTSYSKNQPSPVRCVRR